MMEHKGRIYLRRKSLSVFVGLLLIFASTSLAEETEKKQEIRVFIEQQVLVALEDDEEIYSFDIVTGREVVSAFVPHCFQGLKNEGYRPFL